MNIHQFKPGDRITRTEPVYVKQPAEMNYSLGIKIDQDPVPKFDFVGNELIFLGICNGGVNVSLMDGRTYFMPLHEDYFADWSDGWAMYEPPLEVEFVSEDFEKPRLDKRSLITAAWLLLIACLCVWNHYSPGIMTSLESAFVLGLGVLWNLLWFFEDYNTTLKYIVSTLFTSPSSKPSRQ